MTQTWAGLLSDGDLDAVREALRRGRKVELVRERPGLRLRVSTQKAAPAWGAARTVRLEVWRPGLYATQQFGSVEEMIVRTWMI